jgi:DNA topoisomerase-3
MMPLADAARCRSEADWLIGINGTRHDGLQLERGGFYLTTRPRADADAVHRGEREEKIKYSCRATSGKCAPSSSALLACTKAAWLDTKFKKDENDPENAPSVCGARRLPILIALAACAAGARDGSQADHLDGAGPVRSTSLQREANSRFGFSAKNTLGLA